MLIAYNTLFNLPDEAAQRSCIAGAAALLAPGGRLVVEAFVPDDEPDATDADASASARRDDLSVRHIDPGEVVLTATLHDPAAQTITGQHIQITEHGTRLRPWRVRYLRPDQLDELARRRRPRPGRPVVGLERIAVRRRQRRPRVRLPTMTA